MTVTKKQLWEVFMKTGRVSDYLKYKKAEDRIDFDGSEEIATEFSEELFPQEDN